MSEEVGSLILDSSSIEVNRPRKRAKTDRLDVTRLLGLLARYLAGEHDAFSIVSVPSVDEEDLRRIGRELKLLKKDRTRVSHRIKGLLANQGLVIDLKRDLREQLQAMRLWNGEPLPRHLRERLAHYVGDFHYHTTRIRDLEQKRRDLMRARERGGAFQASTPQAYTGSCARRGDDDTDGRS